jgi:signal transduction histidine kinase
LLRLDRLAEDVAAEIASMAAARDVQLEVHVQPAVVRGDPDRLREAISNVLTNAVRYNVRQGQVRLALTRAGGHATITVADTGIGIGSADLARIFEPFFRADPARSRDVGGAGLGLAVTRAILERHGGRITCDSTPGRGTTVTILIPVVETAAPAEQPPADDTVPQTSTRL